jgi:hypothetical protein
VGREELEELRGLEELEALLRPSFFVFCLSSSVLYQLPVTSYQLPVTSYQ